MTTLADNQRYQDQRFSRLAMPDATLTSIEFDTCVFERCTFTAATFHHCRFTDCRFLTCDLSLAKLPNCTFSNAGFERSKLTGIDWTKTGTSATSRLMMSVRFVECVLDYATFYGMRLPPLTMTKSSAREADFSEADLTGSDFSGTDFTGARFLHTTLEKTSFVDAANYDIDLTANKVAGARFSLPEAVSLLRAFDIVIED